MTNKAAIGYMILAAKIAGRIHDFDYGKIQMLAELMLDQMDEHTEAEAEHGYRNF